MHENSNRIALVMDGSRRHYDVAEALQRRGGLDRMYADWYASPWSVPRLLSKFIRSIRPNLGQRMHERYSQAVDPKRVITNPWLALSTQVRRSGYLTVEEFWKWSSRQTANWIIRKGLGRSNGMYCYVRNVDPILCSYARQQGLIVIGEQMIAPAAIECREYESQQEKWPDWQTSLPLESFKIVKAIEESTWENLDRIIAPSQYVVDGLMDQGVDSEKIELVPYPADFESLDFVDRAKRSDPVTVGFVGQINLRKNAPVFLEIAKRMFSKRMRFMMVGKVQLREEVVNRYRDYVELTGPVPRSEVASKLAGFDIFLFPSTCEGSAGVVLEAMASGLPVLTTPNSGTNVTDGVDGYLFDPADIEGFVDRLEKLSRNPSLRFDVGRAASEKVRESTIDLYGDKILKAFTECRSRVNRTTSADPCGG